MSSQMVSAFLPLVFFPFPQAAGVSRVGALYFTACVKFSNPDPVVPPHPPVVQVPLNQPLAGSMEQADFPDRGDKIPVFACVG